MKTRFQTLGAAVFAFVAVGISATAVSNTLYNGAHERMLIPNIGGGQLLYGQVSSGSIPVNDFTAEQGAEGITLPKDSHNFFTCETGGSVGTTVHDLQGIRAWAYEFRGDEPPFSGKFFVSPGELEANPKYASLNTLDSFEEGRRYYIMNASDLHFQCGDGLSPAGYCGDGVVNGFGSGKEECDDGATDDFDHDGCTATCKKEIGYQCSGEPSKCSLLIPTLPGDGNSSSTSSAKSECQDTDGGDNVFVQGSTTIGNKSGTDYCSSNSELVEYSCGFGFLESLTLNCENGCLNGECMKEQCPACAAPPEGCEGKGTGACGCGPYLNPDGSVCTGTVSSGKTGNLFITKDSTPLRNRQLLGGALGEAALRLQMRADGEDINVTDLQFEVDGDAKSIDRLELYLVGETESFAFATTGGCGSDSVPESGKTFCAGAGGGMYLKILNGSNVDVLVRPRIKTDVVDGVSGHSFVIKINSNAIATETAGAVRARGLHAKQLLQANNGDSEAKGEIFIGTDTPAANVDIVGDTNVVVMSKIISIINANPDTSGITQVPTGGHDIGQFKFEAATHQNSKNGLNKARLDAIIFNVNSNNVVLDAKAFKFYNKADAITTATCVTHYRSGEVFTSAAISGSFSVLCKADGSNVDTNIDQGTSSTFVLQGLISNPKMNASAVSSLQVTLDNFTDPQEPFGVAGSHIRWEDGDELTGTYFDWIEYPDTVVKSTSYES